MAWVARTHHDVLVRASKRVPPSSTDAMTVSPRGARHAARLRIGSVHISSPRGDRAHGDIRATAVANASKGSARAIHVGVTRAPTTTQASQAAAYQRSTGSVAPPGCTSSRNRKTASAPAAGSRDPVGSSCDGDAAPRNHSIVRTGLVRRCTWPNSSAAGTRPTHSHT